jgi:hypothetical protein
MPKKVYLSKQLIDVHNYHNEEETYQVEHFLKKQ